MVYFMTSLPHHTQRRVVGPSIYNEVENIYKEAVVSYFDVIFRNLFGG